MRFNNKSNACSIGQICIQFKMRSIQLILASLAGIIRLSAAAISPLVSGTPVGFAAGATGGGTASPVYPTTIAQLKTYLTSSSAQVIVLSGTYDFTGSEGTQTEQACNNYACTPSQGGQALLNTLNGCGSLSLYDVTIDTAAYNPICMYYVLMTLVLQRRHQLQ